MWVGLDLCDGLCWVKFFFDPPWWVGSKNPLNPTQPDPCGLGWTYVMGWIRLKFFLIHHGGLGQKIPLT